MTQNQNSVGSNALYGLISDRMAAIKLVVAVVAFLAILLMPRRRA